MSKIFRVVFFCCSASDEAEEGIESVMKKDEIPKTKDKSSAEKEEKVMHKAYSEENRGVNNKSDSSESYSISSGSNR